MADAPEPEPVASLIQADPDPVQRDEPEPVPAFDAITRRTGPSRRARSVEPELVQAEAPFSEPETEVRAPEPVFEPVVVGQ